MDMEEHCIGESDSPTFKSIKRRGPSVCCIIATVLGVFLVVSLAAVVGLSVGVNLVSNKRVSSSCLDPECVELGAQVLASLDETFDPCVDFYKFACNKALEQAIIPYDAYETGGFSNLEETKIERFRVQLSKPVDNTTVEAIGKAATYYQSCVNASTLTDDNMDSQVRDFLYGLLTQLGGWPLVGIGESSQTYDINDEGGFLTEILYGSDAFLDLSVQANGSSYILTVDQGGVTDYYEDYSGDTDDYYSDYTNIRERALEILQIINPDISDSVYQAAIDEVINFERDLAEYIDYSDYRSATFGTLTDLMPEFHWIQNMQYYSRIGFFPLEVDASTPVLIYAPSSYLTGLNALIASTDATVLQNYAKWRLVSRLQEYLTPDVFLSYRSIANLKAGRSIPSFRQDMTYEEPPRYVTCVGIIEYEMPFAMARVFSEAYSLNGVAKSVSAVVKRIRAALKERISEKEWLDSTTKQRALNKVDSIIAFLVYPEFIYNDDELNQLYATLDVSTSVSYFVNYINLIKFSTLNQFGLLASINPQKDWDRNAPPTMVNAFYTPLKNQIYILEGILDSPFFKTYWPDYFKFGTIGHIIGHELVHGFDNNGREFDENGNFVDWWSEQAVKEFNTRAQCFVDQYNQYSLPAGPVNGTQTLGENIADNGGLAIAYRAYKDMEETEQMLPGLKYTPDQLFFIGSTQSWCSVVTKEGQEYFLEDVHTPESLRPLGFLSNSPEFAAAFNCPSGSRMNPTHKCEIW